MRKIQCPQISGEGASPEHIRQLKNALIDLCDQMNIALAEVEREMKDGGGGK